MTNKLWWDKFGNTDIYCSLWGHGTCSIRYTLADIKKRGNRYQLTIRMVPTEIFDSINQKSLYWADRLDHPYQKTVNTLEEAKSIVERYIKCTQG